MDWKSMSADDDMIHVSASGILGVLGPESSNPAINSLTEDLRGSVHDNTSLMNVTYNTNTEKTTRWAVNAYNNWKIARQPGIEEIIPDLSSASVEELNRWLSVFVRECKQRDGRDYKHQNLYAMVCGISRYIRKNRPTLNILDDIGMKDFKVSLYDVMKGLQSKQSNIYSVQVSKITRQQWDYFWEKGILGDSNPTSLFYAVYTLFISVTGVTSGLQLRSMTTRNVEVTKDPHTDKYVTTYYPVASMNTRAVSSSQPSEPDRAAIRCTDDGSQPRSFGRLFQLYLSRLPPFFSDLWVRPNTNEESNEWFSKQPLGQNILRTTVRSICQVAGFDGNFSNQSLGRELLSWDHYQIDHLVAPGSGPREGDRNSGIVKQEVTASGEMLSSVTVNTHLPPPAKRLKVETFPSRGDTFPGCLPSQVASPHVSGLGLHSMTPLHRENVTLPANSSSHPFTSSPSTQGTSHCHAETSSQGRSHGTMPNQSPAGAVKDGVRIGQDLRDVNVNIPDHINQCLGLFKDCTIQNVTINIYLDKEGQDSA